MSLELDALGSGFNRSKLNTNTQKTEDYVNDNLLHRDGVAVGQDNSMKLDLDMNGNRFLNVPQPVGPNDLVRLGDLPPFVQVEGVVSFVSQEESVTLTSGQVVVVFPTLAATSCSFYITGLDTDNGRLTNGTGYSVTATTEITLTESYPTGTKVTAVQAQGTIA